MAEYKSQPVSLGKSAEEVYDKLTDMQGLAQAITNVPMDQVPEDKRDMLKQVRVDENSIEVPGGPVGSIVLEKSDCTRPVYVSFEGKGTPVPLTLSAHIQSTSADTCEVTVEVDIKIPAMLKPMINGPMNDLVKQVADSLRAISR